SRSEPKAVKARAGRLAPAGVGGVRVMGWLEGVAASLRACRFGRGENGKPGGLPPRRGAVAAGLGAPAAQSGELTGAEPCGRPIVARRSGRQAPGKGAHLSGVAAPVVPPPTGVVVVDRSGDGGQVAGQGRYLLPVERGGRLLRQPAQQILGAGAV